ncbi:MAG TPA: PAS domain S-box protein [Chitinophagaceae bacterium]|nr:PAS domain S-box protein [Chitinophagaceae bacterium]
MIQDNFINPRKLSAVILIIIILIPFFVLMGWLFNIELLKTILPNTVAMNPTSATLLILSGLSLYLVQEKNYDKAIKIGKYIALAIAVIGIIKFAGFYDNFDIGIDQILFSNKLQGNRTSPNATINFILIGFSLFLIDFRKEYKYVPSQILALLVFIISLLAIIGYLYSATSLYRLSVYLPMRFHTSITFLLLAIGILLSRYRYGFVSVIMHKNFGGHIARRLIPIGIAVPILVGFLRLEGQKLNLYDPQFGSALGVILIIFITSLLMWVTAKSLNKTDGKRKEAEMDFIIIKEKLSENEMKYRTLIENAGVVMYTSTLNGLITFASGKAVQLTGYSMNELIGMHFSKLVDPEFKPQVKANYETQARESIEETFMEFCIRTKTGDIKSVEQSAVLVMENNLPIGFQCIVKDISAKKEMAEVVRKYEVKLFENQERLQSILDNTTSLIYIKDVDGKYLLANKKFKEALNVTDETLIGKTDFDFGDIVQAQRFKATDEEVLKTRKQVELEEVVEMPDGMHNILIIKFPLINSQNEIYGISGIATDITERVKYQEQLLQAKKLAEDAQKLQEQFLANMSHEIRTPMNGIRGMTDLLLETKLDDEQKDFTKTIKRSSDNLLVIINDVLDLSKIQAGKLTIEKIDFNLTEVLVNIKAMFHHRIAKKGLLLQFNVDSAVPEMIKGDPYRLNQILVNLIGNAIKFTHQGGVTVNVSIQKQSKDLIALNFKITDTGIGIETDKINSIFESFTQANINTSRTYGGTGLGLAITKQLLELQGGTILVESKINIGSTFQFTIPYNYSDSKNSISFIGKNSKEHQSLLKGKKILVAEDNDVNQKVIRHVLQKAGGIVDVANHGLEAIAFLKESTKYDIIIMDLQMDKMDGYAATRYIRSVLKLSIPIIAMTATALKGEKEKCMEAGMNDYVSKPFDFQFLYNRISLLLNVKHMSDTKVTIEKSGSGNLFDLSLLEEMDDNEYIAEVLTIFLKNTPERLDELREACISNQFIEVHKTAHKLKSSIGLLKANDLLNVMKKLEENGKAEKSEGLVALAELAIHEYKKLETPLQENLKNIQTAIASAV